MTNDQSTDLEKLIQQASQGDAEAQYNLGVAYANGQGVPQDYAQAMKWLHLAADQGLEFAQLHLARMYDYGLGVPKDDAQAMKWLHLAADQGNACAQYNLGNHYHHTRTKEYVQAYKWFSLAAAQGFVGNYFANAARQKDVVAKQMTPQQITEAEELARNWKPKK